MSQQRRRGRAIAVPDTSAQDMDVEEELSQTQTLTQAQRSLEKHSPDQVNLKVGELVQYCLVRDQKKQLIKRADIIKNVVKEYKDVYPEILLRAKKTLQEVFGFELEEIDTKNHIYVLTNRLEPVEGDGIKVYLEYNKVPHTDPTEYEFQWGARAFKETSKMRILDFVSKIQQKEPKSWDSQYKDSQDPSTSQGPSSSQSTSQSVGSSQSARQNVASSQSTRKAIASSQSARKSK